jgi:hypothetical protein
MYNAFSLDKLLLAISRQIEHIRINPWVDIKDAAY